MLGLLVANYEILNIRQMAFFKLLISATGNW